ncbi:mechanosensitive ion channel family protein [Methanosarcina sp. T3]|uniref:mechanosensitive ion channel family protein n=1 Tax=Methanosarcina sp. T3 TaxID=3439062 RepID=UPI003F863981
MVGTEITDSLYGMFDQFIAFIPTLVAIIILIIVGIILGKFLGKIGAKILDKIGLDDLVDKTVIGGMIKRGQMSTVGFFDAVIRWFVYIIFALIILDILNIGVVNNFVDLVIFYIPLVISALVVLLIGLLIVDFISDLLQKVLISTGIDEKLEQTTFGASIKSGGLTASGIVAGIVRIFGYLIFLTAASDILQLTMISVLLIDITQYLPRVIIAILILVIGILSIDIVMDYLSSTVRGMEIEGADIILPLLRGFLLLILVLVALDTMLIDTSILYLFFGPLAWGIAFVVAFKYGVKDAIVAYARERK